MRSLRIPPPRPSPSMSSYRNQVTFFLRKEPCTTRPDLLRRNSSLFVRRSISYHSTVRSLPGSVPSTSLPFYSSSLFSHGVLTSLVYVYVILPLPLSKSGSLFPRCLSPLRPYLGYQNPCGPCTENLIFMVRGDFFGPKKHDDCIKSFTL